MTGDEPDDAIIEALKIYEPIDGLPMLKEKLRSYMTQYNETVRGSGLDLVFFDSGMMNLI